MFSCFLIVACLTQKASAKSQATSQPQSTIPTDSVAGNGTAGYSGDQGPATSAQLNDPNAVVVDNSGSIYIADTCNHRVRKVDRTGRITTVAGNGKAGYSGDGALATAASLESPKGLALDSSGNLYIADFQNSRVRRVSPAGIISTVAGNGKDGYSGDGGPAIFAQLQQPASVTLDVSGNLFIADWNNNRIRKVNPTGMISTIAGDGAPGYSGDGGPAVSARLRQPESVVTDTSGNLCIADSGNHCIRIVDTAGKISTVAGLPTSLRFPRGVALDAWGNLYIADSGNHFIRFRSQVALAVKRVESINESTSAQAQPGIDQTQPVAEAKPSVSVSPPQAESEGMGVIAKELSFGDVFPILHSFYDTNPIGTLLLRNTEDTPATHISVSLIVRQYMDAPKECATLDELKPREEKTVSLFGLFKNTVFEIKESTKVPAEITVSYSLKGSTATVSKVATLRILDRNAMSWDDTNKAAAFIMPKEPAVLMLSNQINSYVKDSINRAIDRNLQTAMALHDALRLYGIAYVSPPLTSYAVRSQNKQAIDSVKFPLETIEYRSGDCSDLSVLYCSLLESVQIETALITIPGHIFMAFALESNEDEVRKTFSSADEFIYRGGKVWVPVEVTERERPFLAAWHVGATEWRENLSKKQADFYSVRESWNKYEPVNFPGAASQMSPIDSAKVVKDFQDDLAHLISREISGRESSLMATIEKSGESSQSLNALGVFYAQYDLSEKAEIQFQAILKKIDYVPALVNLGNLRFLTRDFDAALTFYQRAAKREPHNPLVLLGMARANHEQQNYGLAKKEYEELKTLNPELATRFSYLQLQAEEATRAATVAQVSDVVVWAEEK